MHCFYPLQSPSLSFTVRIIFKWESREGWLKSCPLPWRCAVIHTARLNPNPKPITKDTGRYAVLTRTFSSRPILSLGEYNLPSYYTSIEKRQIVWFNLSCYGTAWRFFSLLCTQTFSKEEGVGAVPPWTVHNGPSLLQEGCNWLKQRKTKRQ